jgi:hypothetical protein
MKVLMLYRKGGQSQALAEDFSADYGRLHPRVELELIEADSPHAQEMVSLYGIVDYPAILATADDGLLLQMWQGQQLPLMKELNFYLQ